MGLRGMSLEADLCAAAARNNAIWCDAMEFAPALPLVAYESGAELARSKILGFAEIGPLRIWQAVHA